MSDEIKDYAVSVRLTKAQVARLQDYARERGISQSDAIRQWVDTLEVLPVFPQRLLDFYRFQGRETGHSPRVIFENVLRQFFWQYWQ